MAYGKVPEWLDQRGIKPGGYLCDTKARRRREMKAGCSAGAFRLHACLVLHSAGYQQELAVRTENGEQVPLTPKDACALTGLSLNHFSEYMNELEAEGLARREGSVRGSVRLYAWAVPRPVEKPKCSPRAGEKRPSVVSPGFDALMRATKTPLDFVPARGDKEEIEALYAERQAAEERYRARCKSVRARGVPLNKEEREEREEREESSSSLFGGMTTTEVLNVLPPNPPAGNGRETHSDAGPTGNSRDRRRARRSASAGAGQGASTERLGIRGRRDKPADAPLPNPDAAGPDAAPVPAQNSQNKPVIRDAGVCPVVVAEAIAASPVGAADPDMANGIWRECRKASPDITPDELAALVRTKAVISARKDSPLPYLRTALVNEMKKLRAARATAERLAAERLAKELAEARKQYTDPDTEEYLKRALEARYPFLVDDSS